MTTNDEFLLDEERDRRIGLSEAVYCAGKSPAQIAAILRFAEGRGRALLLTRLSEESLHALPSAQASMLDYDPVSRTAYAGSVRPPLGQARVAVVTAGTSDIPVAREAMRTLYFEGHRTVEIDDVGVAGLWRLMRRADELRVMPVVIVAAGMDAALPSVIGGLVPGLVIAVPTSVGYGVASGGRAALEAALASCAPGVVVVNIDNGYGAACAAVRALGGTGQRAETAKWNVATS
ncbi:MAG TPA: nickel pincer cofactor biosynthesis protein LarB [Acetobacteraceae bacterium]|nr:nickel pincer cofactor biosynthesis protein LarB [Acetobacteraceae bacterium]